MRNFKSNTEDRFRENQNSRRFNNMYDVTCNKCRNKCQVPFKPTGSKPIYCDSCFKKNNQLNEDKSSGSSSEQFNQINAKLDRILKVLENLEVEDESEEENDEEDSNDK